MSYKGILLGAVLAPIAITSYGKSDIEQKLQQLKEARFQKELELSELGAKIAEKYELLEATTEEAIRFFNKYLKEHEIEDDRAIEFAKNFNAESDETEGRLEKALAGGNVKGFLVKELFDNKNISDDDLNATRFFDFRFFFEEKLLKSLIEQYEECLQEIIEIDKEVELLKHG